MPRDYITIERNKDTTRITGQGMESITIIRADHVCDICEQEIAVQKGTGFGISVSCEYMITLCGGCISKEWLRMLEGRMEADDTKRKSPTNATDGRKRRGDKR